MRKRENGFSAFEILIVIVFIGLIAAIGWLVWDRQQNPKSQTNEVTKTSSSISEPSDVTKLVKEYLGTKYKVSDYSNSYTSPENGNELVIKTSVSAPVQKVDGYNFYSSYNGGSSIYISTYYRYDEHKELPTDYDKNVRSMINEKLANAGFVKGATVTNNNLSMDYRELNEYRFNGIICNFENENVQATSTHLSCGKIDQYKQAADAIKPFVDITKQETAGASFTNLVITDSPIDGYKRAQINVCNGGCSVSLYYKAESGEWTYFRGTQGIIQCSEFNSSDLKKSFSGEKCLSSSGVESVVSN